MNSSQQTNCYTTLTTNQISTLNSGTITFTNNSCYTSSTCIPTWSVDNCSATITISPSTSGSCYVIGGNSWCQPFSNIDTTNIFYHQQEWINSFPEWDRIQKMCEEYPGLHLAFEKFKTVYKLVKDHYDTPEDQRPKP
jgi:hypothetical protein